MWSYTSASTYTLMESCFIKHSDNLTVNTVFCNLIIVQRDATQNSLFIILQVHSTCFGCQTHQSSGANKTVTIASVTDHIFGTATSLQRDQVGYVGER